MAIVRRDNVVVAWLAIFAALRAAWRPRHLPPASAAAADCPR